VKLTDLTIRNFRNIASLDIELPETGVVIIGGNGQGKTNLLEAIYYLVLFRSFRGAKDRELVRFGTPGFFVAGSASVRVTAGYEVAGQKKKVTLDRAGVPRIGAAVGRVLAVPFSPADREIVVGGPAGRRRYLDVLLALSTPDYLTQLTAMRAALKQRNAALRAGRGDTAQAFDAPFAAAGTAVRAARVAWVTEWADRFLSTSASLGERAEAVMTYESRSEEEQGSAADLEQSLAGNIDRDIRRGMTTVGPHRDELRLTVAGRSLRRYGSAGQHRTAAIALRLMEAATFATATGEVPIALYDDVFAELDAERQVSLLRLIQDTLPGQAIVTAPRDSEVPPALLERPRWAMTGGQLEQQ
jgi:DNA replication and repair protein RecF